MKCMEKIVVSMKQPLKTYLFCFCRYSVSKTFRKNLGFSSILLTAVPQGKNNVTDLKRFTLWGALETWLLQGSFVYSWQVDRGDLAGWLSQLEHCLVHQRSWV